MHPLGDTKTLEFRDFSIVNFKQPPAHSISWHAHETPTLLFVFGGSVDEVFKTRAFECRSSSLLIRPGAETHAHAYGAAGAECLAVQIKPDWFKSEIPNRDIFDSVFYDRKSSLAFLGNKIRRELAIRDEVSGLAIESAFLEIVVRLSRQKKYLKQSDTPRWLEEARDLIHDRFREKLSLKTVSGEVGIHPSTLSESFHTSFGMTVGEYVRNLRLEHAFTEITTTRKPMSEIAIESGFYDQSHFTKRFKERFGQTPKTIRLQFCGS